MALTDTINNDIEAFADKKTADQNRFTYSDISENFTGLPNSEKVIKISMLSLNDTTLNKLMDLFEGMNKSKKHLIIEFGGQGSKISLLSPETIKRFDLFDERDDLGTFIVKNNSNGLSSIFQNFLLKYTWRKDNIYLSQGQSSEQELKKVIARNYYKLEQ